jgi:hypothetical protein
MVPVPDSRPLDIEYRETVTRHGKALLIQAIDSQSLECVLIAFQATNVLELSMMLSGYFQRMYRIAATLQQTK